MRSATVLFSCSSMYVSEFSLIKDQSKSQQTRVPLGVAPEADAASLAVADRERLLENIQVGCVSDDGCKSVRRSEATPWNEFICLLSYLITLL